MKARKNLLKKTAFWDVVPHKFKEIDKIPHKCLLPPTSVGSKHL
jgi:hypothetical protein